MFIFDAIGSLFGYVLWLFYSIFNNYGLAIICFTIVVKLVLFPMSIHQQKSMAKNAAMSQKQQEIKKKYAGDQKKINEEMQKLYDKEVMITCRYPNHLHFTLLTFVCTFAYSYGRLLCSSKSSY